MPPQRHRPAQLAAGDEPVDPGEASPFSGPGSGSEEKVRVVLSILAGETTIAQAARQAKVSETSVGKWKQQFLEAGRLGLASGGSSRPSSREEQLAAEVAELTTALGRGARRAAGVEEVR